MKIDNEVKNQIRKSVIIGEYSDAYKNLFKLYNKHQENVFDRCFVLYNLSLTTKKMGSIEESKKYITEAKLYMADKEGYDTEKGCILWLYIELKRNQIDEKELMEIYQSLKQQHFKYLDEDDKRMIGINGSIEVLKDNYVEAELLLIKCFNMDYIDSANNILEDIKNRNIEKYNELINKYYYNKSMYA